MADTHSGSGASTTPTALTQHGFKVDLVHPDPLPLLLATRYLGAKKPDTITPLRGDKYLRVVADLIGSGEYGGGKWSICVVELESDDHWRQTLGWDFVRNVREVLEDNGILAVVSLSWDSRKDHDEEERDLIYFFFAESFRSTGSKSLRYRPVRLVPSMSSFRGIYELCGKLHFSVVTIKRR